MKKTLILILFLFLIQYLHSQSLKDINVLPIGVTLNQILQLKIIGDNIIFHYDSSKIILNIDGDNSVNLNKTEIKISSSVKWKLIYGAKSPYLIGTNPNNILELDNIKFTIISNGLHKFGQELYSFDTNNGTKSSTLQTYPITLIQPNTSNAGDDEDNYFIIDWIFVNNLIDSINPDIYSVDIIFEITAE
jgi:hypothetical protein